MRTASGELNRIAHLFDLRQKCLETMQAIFQKKRQSRIQVAFNRLFSLHPTPNLLTESDKRAFREVENPPFK